MGGEALLGEWLPLQSAAMSLLLALVVIALMLSITEKKKHPPAVPISAIMRDLMMFKEERPHRIFTAWAKKYGPIYSVRTGAGAVVVLNSSQTAKQAMVDNHSSISTKRLTKALQTLSLDQTMVALSDYGEEHKLLKKMMITHLLGTTPQRNNRFLREEMVQRIVDSMHSEIRANSKANVGLLNISKHIMNQLFPFALKQLIGRDVESVYVEEMRSWVCLQQIYDIVVGDVAKGALEINWRDFVPYIGPWLPNRPLQNKLRQLTKRRAAVVRALIEEERKLLSSGKEPNCYLDMLLKEGKKLQGKQLETAIWEPLVESIITSHVTMVWAMFELGRNPECQKRLRKEIKRACGDGVVREDDVHKLQYLKAIIRETLRKYPPLPLLPLRYVHEDVELDGYHVPAGWKILLNIHGIGKDEKQWEKAETWNPDRHLTARAEEESMDLQGTSMTFGAGKRLCAGWMQAVSIVSLTIATIAHDFEWRVAFEGEDKVETVKNTGTHRLHPLIALVTISLPTLNIHTDHHTDHRIGSPSHFIG